LESGNISVEAIERIAELIENIGPRKPESLKPI
jgi:hypothetical protein